MADQKKPPQRPIDDEFPDSPMDEMDVEGLFGEGEGFSESDQTEVGNQEETTLEKLNVSKIPLQVRLEAGRIYVSLEELQKMGPGYKMPLDINPRILQLTVEGKAIGRGELIEMGDTIGIRIIEIYQ